MHIAIAGNAAEPSTRVVTRALSIRPTRDQLAAPSAYPLLKASTNPPNAFFLVHGPSYRLRCLYSPHVRVESSKKSHKYLIFMGLSTPMRGYPFLRSIVVVAVDMWTKQS